MPDLSASWGADLSVGPTGDLATVDGIDLATQRVIRRLLTNPGDLWFHPEYGAGLPALIGQAVPVAKITGLIRSQLFLEASVARDPDPVISVTPYPSGAFAVSITYWAASNGAPQLLAFTVSP